MQRLNWARGRQDGGYHKLLLLTGRWPWPFDLYLLRFPEGSSVPEHADPLDAGRHYRLNVILKRAKRGGEFVCGSTLLRTRRIILFRPDLERHCVSEIREGTRYVLSLGWVTRD